MDTRDYPAGQRQQRTSWYWVDSAFDGHCKQRECRKPITMAQNVSTGKWMPFSGKPVALRTKMVQAERAGEWRQAMELDLADSHFVDCPARDKFRRPR